MEFDEYSTLLSRIHSCYSKWEEVKKERDVLKSRLEKANHKIEELEASLAVYRAKDSAIEEERHISSRVIEEFVREGPSIVKKIDKVEQNVSWLSEAVETLLSNVHKTSSLADANNSISKSYEEKIQIDDRDGLVIKNDDSKDLLGISDIDLHVIDVNIGDVEYSSAYSDGKFKPPLSTHQHCSINEDINCIECSNILSSSTALLSGEGNSLNHAASIDSSDLEKNNDCGLLLTELIASSSQWFTHCNDEHSESYSLSNNEIPLPTMSTSLNVSSESWHAINEVDHTSEEIVDDQELTIQNTRNDENSSTINVTSLESDGTNTSEEITCSKSPHTSKEIASFQNNPNSYSCNDEYEVMVGTDRKSLLRNTNNFKNPSRISATQLEFPNASTSKEITDHPTESNSSPSSNNECVVIVNSTEESMVAQNTEDLENSSQVSATQLEPEICNISDEITSSQNELNSSPSNKDENGRSLLVDSDENSSRSIQNTKSHENSSLRGAYLKYKPLDIKIVIEKLVDVEENLTKKVENGEDIDNVDNDETEMPHGAQISSSPLCYNLRTRNKLAKKKSLNSDGDGCCSSDSTNERSNTEKLSSEITWTISDSKKEVVNSCSTNGRLSSMSSMKPQKSTRRKIQYNFRRVCLICKKENTNNPGAVPEFKSSLALFKHILENHPQPNSIYIRCPYTENRCIHHFRYIERLSAHVKLFHKKKSWPCNSCDENFENFPDLQNHIEKEHSMAVDSSIMCEYCGYIACSSELMDTHLLKHRDTQKMESCSESKPAETPTEEATDGKNDAKCEVSSSHIVSSLNNQFKNVTKECEVIKQDNLDEMKLQYCENLDSQHLKNRCNSFPGHYSNHSMYDHCYALTFSENQNRNPPQKHVNFRHQIVTF